MRATVRVTLGQSGPAQGVPSNRLAVIEGMMYGCRVAEVLTICFTAKTLDGLCVALRNERDHVTAMYEEDRRVERLWQEHAVAAGHPQPPRPPPAPPPPTQWPPQEQPPQWQPPPAQWPEGLPQWPPPLWTTGPSQPPTGHRRAHLMPGPGAAEAPPHAAPLPGGTAAAGDPMPPPVGVWAPPAPAGAAGRTASQASPPSRYLPGAPEDPLYSYWATRGGPPNPPAEAQRAPRGSVGREMGWGGTLPVRASPYADARRNPGGATRAPGPAASGYGPAQAGGWGQPHGGWPQPPRHPPAGEGFGGAEAHRNPAPRTEADFYRQWGCGGTPPHPDCRRTACPPRG